MAVEDILRAADHDMHKLENGVIRAAVDRYYVNPQWPDATPEHLEAKLAMAVQHLVDSMPAVGWEKRDGN